MNRFKGDEIVISGISGIFPNAENVKQFGEKLFDKVDMVNKTCQSHIKHKEFPPYIGQIEGLEKFDAHFFRVTAKQAIRMEPPIGKLMEQTYSALFDAGVNPETLKGSKIGVYIASTQMDGVNLIYKEENADAFALTGASKTMLANRISYWIDGKGPSYSFDNGCAGSMAALEMAYKAMKYGEMDCAIVGGSNVIISPELTLNMKRSGLLCLDGKTKCFDKTGDGFVRSNAVNVIFLQRAKDAKRIYSEVYHVKGKYFASPNGMFSTTRDPRDIEKFLREFYSEIDVSPADVEYIEANCFGISESDGNELEAIGYVFAKEKTLKIGSVKSNMGNTEAASGACSITKMCLAYQKGQLPANLHFKEPQNNITAVNEGRLEVVTDNVTFSRNFTAINNFCYTGANFHTLLKGHYIPKDNEKYKSAIPRLVLASGRKEESVQKIFDTLETNPVDQELFALLNNFFKHYVPGHTARGYTILESNKNNETVCLSKGFDIYSGNARPVWFLFSGLGSQWAGMGEGLLRIPVFAAAIEKCQKLMLPKGLDIIKIITDKNPGCFNILNSIVAITAIQIGLFDVLTSIGIVPDNIIGHSVGETACAYADGCLTAEETILASYCRAIAGYDTKFIEGKMAAVGLGHEEVSKICPPEIEIACHNSSESTTISGPAQAVIEFLKILTDTGIFAKEVNSYNIAFHSKYIAQAGPKMLELTKKVITNPKPRSQKWLTSCYLPEDWYKPESQHVSAEYLVHNLLGTVYFEETAKYIPKDAIIIEIAPHGLLQAIMRRSHKECINLSLTRKDETDSATFLLKAIGNLYQIGLNPNLEGLYTKVEFPVSTETSTLSHLVGWDYSMDWKSYYVNKENDSSSVKDFIISIYDDDFAFFKDHIQNGHIVIPEVSFLVFVWETFANILKMNYEDMSVVFEDIKVHKQIIMLPEETLRLQIVVQKSCSKFQVINKEDIIVDGSIFSVKKPEIPHNIKPNDNEHHLNQNDIYAILRSKGYLYVGKSQSIISSNLKGNKAIVKWNEQWITFLDSIIQLRALFSDHDGVSNVKSINKLSINMKEHKHRLITKFEEQCYNAMISEDGDVYICGGVVFQGIIFNELPKLETVRNMQILDVNIRDCDNPALNNYEYFNSKDKIIDQRIKLIAKDPGMTMNLTWTNAPDICKNTSIQVCYSGLSMKDCKLLSSSSGQSFGMDFSGIDKNGTAVMGILAKEALASTVEADYDLLWPVPQHWTLAEAATVPLPFLNAFYCLTIKSSVSKYSNVCVIGAAGALGQAVICVALTLNCTIYGTVANADKKRFLLKLFPELDANNIGYTYDDSFKTMVIERTNNKKCRVVISTGSGKIRETAMGCVGFGGDFLDLNDSDQQDNKTMPMFFLREAKNYKSVNISTIFYGKFQRYKKVLHTMISEGIAKGFVRPLTYNMFSPLEINRAFNFISSKNNRGRVLINMSEIVTSRDQLVKVPRILLSPTKSFIVLWDGSELGVEFIEFLIKRGAKNLLIHCDSKLMTGYFHFKYASWKKFEVTIVFNSDDLQTEYKCRDLMKQTEAKLGTLEGIFVTCNNYIKSSKIVEENTENIALIVSNLDLASRQYKDLRYFGLMTAASLEFLNENIQNDIEKIYLCRKELGLPFLYLSYSTPNKIQHQNFTTALLNVFETSSRQKNINVHISSKMDNEEDNITKINISKQFEAGLKAFYRYIPENEIDATEPMVQMKTKICSDFESELNMDPEHDYVIMIPGFEGNAECLTSISERLKKRVIALQLDPYWNDSIPKITKRLLEYMKTRIHIKSPFYLMGYSFGVNIALEIAALLEKEGILGVVFCLDSSPDALRLHLDAYLGILTEKQLQNCVLEHFYTLLGGKQSHNFNLKLKEAEEWTEKVEILINEAKYNVAYSHEYMKSILQAAYQRINMAKEYKPSFKLDSEIVLIKGILHPNAKTISHDYDLSEYTNKPVTVFDIESDHVKALSDCRVSNYINRFFIS